MSGKILVIGATGTVGAPLVAELLARGEKVKGASRSLKPQLPAGVEAVHLDLSNPATLEPALVDVDRIYAMEPTGSADSVTTLAPVIEAAARRGIKVVLQSAMGVDADDNIPMRKLELLLEKSGAPFVILRPNWFVDNFVTYWASGIRKGEVRLPAGEGKTSFIDARDIAAAAAGALTTNAHDGQAFVLTGREAHSYAEALELLSETLGRKIVYRAVDVPTFIGESVADGLSPDYAEVIAAIFQTVAEGWAADVTDAVDTLSGRPPRPLKSALQDLAGKF
jgi:uncharacterized protein YbjT (DUF2867 family)